MPVAQAMLLALAAGACFGYFLPEWARELAFVSNVFLQLIKSIIAPVLFAVLVRALATGGTFAELGRVGWRAIVYFELSSSLALLIGWFAVLWAQPGVGIQLPASTDSAKALTIDRLIEGIFPTSIMDAMARGDVLQIVVFSILFGLACRAAGERARAMVNFADALAAIAFRYTNYVMYAAPAGVFAAMALTVANSGGAALAGLARFVALAWAAQVVFLVLVLGGALVLAGVPLRRFAHYAREPFLVAFATTSSAAALPRTLEKMAEYGIPERVLGIVAPLSLSFNLSGSCVHLAMCTLFIAQAAGRQMSWTEQAVILLTLKLTSKGVAGIPRANFVILSGLFATFGLPVSGLTMLLGVDALIDMVRTSVNVVGHCVACPVIARWAGYGTTQEKLDATLASPDPL
ncbi:MAG: cation:dicarboxylase symporter family transporter [Bryobacteraceae bacterium]|nr:cation:dicarboxylase symporter family transporter [Bryobacteraceae bacterium]